MFKIRRTLIVGLGARGAQIVGSVHRTLQARIGGLPVVRCLSVVADAAEVPPNLAGLILGSPESATRPVPSLSEAWAKLLSEERERLAAFFGAELLEAHRLSHAQDCTRRGWPVAPGPGAAAYVVADLGDPMAACSFAPIARVVRQTAERRAPQGVALCGLGFLPDAAAPPEEAHRLAAAHEAVELLKEVQVAPLPSLSPPGPTGEDGDDTFYPPLFNEGCYLLTVANEDGLAADGETAMNEMAAAWLAELLLTPLGLALDRRTPVGGGADFGSFGLARWRFPADELVDYLSARLTQEMLHALLAPPSKEAPAPPGFSGDNAIAPPPLWPGTLRFPATADRFIPPDLGRIRGLRHEVDGAADAARKQLLSAARARDPALVEAAEEGAAALRAGVDGVLDAPGGGLTAAEQGLTAWQRQWQREAEESAARAVETRRRQARLDGPLTEAGEALGALLARFPGPSLLAWLRLLIRPRKAIGLLLAYRQIEERLTAYLAVHQARWRLEAEALEGDWRTSFYRRLVEAAQERLEELRRFRGRLLGLRDAPDAGDDLTSLLEDNALPPGLDGHYYRRTVGEVDRALGALLAVFGPLSHWAAEELSPDELKHLIDEFSRERFGFLYEEVHLDQLLARTYRGRELKARLQELLSAASPFWCGDDAPLTPAERAEAARVQFIGLPQPERSPLADLLEESPLRVSCYATGDPHRIMAVQVRRGLPLRALPLLADYRTAWEAQMERRRSVELESKGENQREEGNDVQSNDESEGSVGPGGRSGEPDAGLAQGEGQHCRCQAGRVLRCRSGVGGCL